MHAHTRFEITLTEAKNENIKIWDYIRSKFPNNAFLTNYKRDKAGVLKEQVIPANEAGQKHSFRKSVKQVSGENPIITVEESYDYVWIEDITEMSKELAETTNAPFEMKGIIDSSESAGEYMDFLITFKDRKLTVASSCWYLLAEAEMYEDVDEFNEEYGTEFSDEEFETLCEKGGFFILDSGDGDVVTEVPLNTTKEILIGNSAENSVESYEICIPYCLMWSAKSISGVDILCDESQQREIGSFFQKVFSQEWEEAVCLVKKEHGNAQGENPITSIDYDETGIHIKFKKMCISYAAEGEHAGRMLDDGECGDLALSHTLAKVVQAFPGTSYGGHIAYLSTAAQWGVKQYAIRSADFSKPVAYKFIAEILMQVDFDKVLQDIFGGTKEVQELLELIAAHSQWIDPEIYFNKIESPKGLYNAGMNKAEANTIKKMLAKLRKK